ncbi:MAG: hypothetical protein AB1546_10915, partial [bacterium]
MRQSKTRTTRTIAFVLFVAISTCPAVFIPSAIEAARKSIIQSAEIKNWHEFSIRELIPYSHLKKIKAMNDNIDYIFTLTPYTMVFWGNDERGRYDYESQVCAVGWDDSLLGSMAEKVIKSGRNFTTEEMKNGENVIIVGSGQKRIDLGMKRFTKKDTIRLCP